MREKWNKLIKPSPLLAGKKRTRKEVDYNEGLLEDYSESEEECPAPKTSKKLKESEPYTRARYEAKELIDYAAKEKDGHFLRDSVSELIQRALLDSEQDTEPLIHALQ